MNGRGERSRGDGHLVLVAGGAGFLGSHLCTRLVDRGDRVVCVDDFSTGRPGNVEHLLGRGSFELVEADVTKPEALVPLAGVAFDTVVHLASPASPPAYLARPIATLDAGSLATRWLVELAHRHRARFVLASTSEVYGDPLEHPQHESYWGNVNPIGERSVYDEAKRFAESLTMAYRRTFDLDAVVVRIFNTYGPRMQPDDGRVVSNFVVQALGGIPLTVYGDGSQTRSFCYVDDLVAGLVAAADATTSGPVNLGNPDEFTMVELAELVLELTGSDAALEFRPLPSDDPRQRCPDITRARSELGWEPRVDLRDGLVPTIEWFRSVLT